MTGVLVDEIARRRPRVLAGPRCCPCIRVFHYEAIEQRLCVKPREALDDVQILCRSSEPGLVCEIRRVYDERVAFPAADRVAEPLADALREVLPADTDDARVVHHF